MKFACDSCQTKYTIPDEKVRGKVLKIRCKKCGAVITVKEEASAPSEPEAPPLEERTRVADIGLLEKLRQAEENRQTAPITAPAPAPRREPEPPPQEWFVMINGEQVGPLSPDDLAAKAHGNEINDRSHVWRDGMGDWKRAADVAELADLFPPPAPPPPPARSPPPPRPAAAVAAPGADYGDDDDNVPTLARQMPDLKALFGEGEAKLAAKSSATKLPAKQEPEPDRPEMTFDDAPPSRGNGVSNGHAAPAPSNNLADLMGDLGDEDSGEHTGVRPLMVGPGDPFSAVPDSPQLAKPTIGEQTRFFMKKAGVTNRNPWWKYAIFVVLVLGVPVVALYSLGKAGVGGTVTIIDATTGEEKLVPKFSLDNVAQNGIAALLAGKPKVDIPLPPPKKNGPVVKKASTTDGKALVDPNAAEPKANLSDADKKKIADSMLKNPNSGLIGDDPKSNPASGPVDHSHDTKGPDVDKGGDGLSTEAVAKVVADNSTSFNKCVEDKLKRDPSWKGGKVNLSVKIGPSGTVLESTIDKDDVAHSDVGDCIKGRVKRMHFPRFSGDEPQEVQFPLVLTNGG